MCSAYKLLWAVRFPENFTLRQQQSGQLADERTASDGERRRFPPASEEISFEELFKMRRGWRRSLFWSAAAGMLAGALPPALSVQLRGPPEMTSELSPAAFHLQQSPADVAAASLLEENLSRKRGKGRGDKNKPQPESLWIPGRPRGSMRFSNPFAPSSSPDPSPEDSPDYPDKGRRSQNRPTFVFEGSTGGLGGRPLPSPPYRPPQSPPAGGPEAVYATIGEGPFGPSTGQSGGAEGDAAGGSGGGGLGVTGSQETFPQGGDGPQGAGGPVRTPGGRSLFVKKRLTPPPKPHRSSSQPPQRGRPEEERIPKGLPPEDDNDDGDDEGPGRGSSRQQTPRSLFGGDYDTEGDEGDETGGAGGGGAGSRHPKPKPTPMPRRRPPVPAPRTRVFPVAGQPTRGGDGAAGGGPLESAAPGGFPGGSGEEEEDDEGPPDWKPPPPPRRSQSPH
ncbi:hypothetical protein Efla_005395 [Eimeria flavescens]